ncbi:hypothetical protein D3C87_1738160 [compost metagenome]
MDATHQVGRGQPAHGHGGGGFTADRLRQFDQGRRRDEALGAVGPQRIQEAGVGHTIAYRDIGHTFADGIDHPGGFDAHAGRQRHRIQTTAEIGVGEVQADRFMAQPNLTWSGIADLYFFPAQDFRAACFIHANSVWHSHSPCF